MNRYIFLTIFAVASVGASAQSSIATDSIHSEHKLQGVTVKSSATRRLGGALNGMVMGRCGIEPIWASEIEKAPISITKRHFPDMAHLGDVTKLDGREIPPVHIITFGSPCQNLSQIGNRKGLAGEITPENYLLHLGKPLSRRVKRRKSCVCAFISSFVFHTSFCSYTESSNPRQA